MRRKKKAPNLKRITAILASFIIIPLAFKGLVFIEPTLTAAAQKAAFFSAGVGFIEGSIDLLKQTAEKKSTDDTQPQITDAFDENTFEESDLLDEFFVAEPPKEEPPKTAPPENSGSIVRSHYKAGSSSAYINIAGNAYLKNATKVAKDKIQAELKKQPEFKISKSKEPQVLIMHTHTTESYEMKTLDYYDKSYNSRTTDNTKNMVSVGDKIAEQLELAGIGYIHDTTQHDYPSYNGSYDRSVVTVTNILKKYPSIKVVLDVHRDAIQQSDGTRIAPVAEINGKNAAQVMIISGCDDGTMNYPNYMKNLRFAGALQTQFDKDYPGLARPILFAYKKYNQHLTTGSILLEMGAHGNSLEEAQYTGELVGKSLANLLNTMVE